MLHLHYKICQLSHIVCLSHSFKLPLFKYIVWVMCHQSHSFFMFPTHRHQIINLFEKHFSFNCRHSLIHSLRNHFLCNATLYVCQRVKTKEEDFRLGTSSIYATAPPPPTEKNSPTLILTSSHSQHYTTTN
jgi:hypothetical protein